MNPAINSNYQPVFGMRQNLKLPEIIQRKAKQTYQHISPSVYNKKYKYISPYFHIPNRVLPGPPLYLKILAKNLIDFRRLFSYSKCHPKVLIEYLKSGKRLCKDVEETLLATYIGKINGQKNIYSGSIKGMDHCVSFITNKPVKESVRLALKDKEAIIIDTQLGITDYVGNYYAKLKAVMNEAVPDKSDFRIIPFANNHFSKVLCADLKSNYPELLIKDYKNIKL